jgi:hypothetical protein
MCITPAALHKRPSHLAVGVCGFGGQAQQEGRRG